MFLEIPCPRCGEEKLQRPQQSGIRYYSKCAGCGRKSLYVIHDRIDGSQSYSIVPVGNPGSGMIRATFWITREQAQMLEELSIMPGMKSSIVRQALDNYSHTLRVNS